MTKFQEKYLKIQMRMQLDPHYIEKARKSICQNCKASLGFNGEYYDCIHAMNVTVKYKREGIFHTQIIECSEFINQGYPYDAKKHETFQFKRAGSDEVQEIDIGNVIPSIHKDHLSGTKRGKIIGSSFGGEKNMVELEELAKELHEAGREAVEKKAVVNPNTHSHYLEWNELEEHMKEGRRIQSRYLLKKYRILNKEKLKTKIKEIFDWTAPEDRLRKILIILEED